MVSKPKITVDGMNGNELLKTYALLSMEDKMAV